MWCQPGQPIRLDVTREDAEQVLAGGYKYVVVASGIKWYVAKMVDRRSPD